MKPGLKSDAQLFVTYFVRGVVLYAIGIAAIYFVQVGNLSNLN